MRHDLPGLDSHFTVLEIFYPGPSSSDKIRRMDNARKNHQGDRGWAGPTSFQTTCWSVVISARDGQTPDARAALETLCATYWYPLYAFVRRKGYDADAAQDLVQGFFARLLEKGDLAAVERSRGRFRSFLMAACAHYLANQAVHDRALIRGGGRSPISIDLLTAEGRYGDEPAHTLTAERLYDRQWALSIVENAVERLSDEMRAAGKVEQFEAMRPALIGDGERVSYRAIAEALGLSENATRVAVHRVRRRCRQLVRDEVLRTIADPNDLDEEMRSILSALGD